MNFPMHKMKPGTTRTVKKKLKGTIENFVASDNVFSVFMGCISYG